MIDEHDLRWCRIKGQRHERGVAELEPGVVGKRAKACSGRRQNEGWHLARDLTNMLIVSEAIARSALLRRESRGAHSRLDFTGVDPALSVVNHCVRKRGGAMEIEATPLPAMPPELKALFEEPAKEKVG